MTDRQHSSPDTASLESALSSLPAEQKALLEKHGFDRQWLLGRARSMLAGGQKNQVEGRLEPPTGEDVVDTPRPGDDDYEKFRERGIQALRTGECALVVLAGGMATRMGGVVKALVEALPGRSFLDLRLQEQQALGECYGKRPPLWLMTSHATDGETRAALGDRLDGYSLATFVQGLSVRLAPDGALFRDERGQPSFHAPGHGDLPGALQRSSLLHRFVAEGGKYVLVTNLDNLGGGLDPTLIGYHLSQELPVTCEVVDKVGSDKGGIPVRLDGRPVVLEEFRLPDGFDPASVRVFNVNSFGFDAKALLDLELDWTYFQVTKKVDGQDAIQFERLINEVTFALPTRYVRVPREGSESRFLPVKDFSELEKRQDDLRALAEKRGML